MLLPLDAYCICSDASPRRSVDRKDWTVHTLPSSIRLAQIGDQPNMDI